MKVNYLIKTNYLHHYSLRLLVGNILLTMPTLCVALLVEIWGKLDFLLILPISLSMGILLVFPSTTTIARLSKERVAVDALLGGLAMMVILCFVLAPLKNAPIKWIPIQWATTLKEKKHILRDQSFLVPKVTGEASDPKGSSSKAEHLEHLG